MGNAFAYLGLSAQIARPRPGALRSDLRERFLAIPAKSMAGGALDGWNDRLDGPGAGGTPPRTARRRRRFFDFFLFSREIPLRF